MYVSKFNERAGSSVDNLGSKNKGLMQLTATSGHLHAGMPRGNGSGHMVALSHHCFKPWKTFLHPFNDLSSAGRNELNTFADSTPHLCTSEIYGDWSSSAETD